jgi:hypothetical protein
VDRSVEASGAGEITIVRYADDAILGFERHDQAESYLREVQSTTHFPLPTTYSNLNAAIGSIRVARRAGQYVAARLATANTSAAPPYEIGSSGLSPNR